MAFLPDDYEAPKGEGGKYFKVEPGDNRLRILTKPVMGYVGWDKTGDKPVPKRSEDRDDVAHLSTAQDKVKHFWAVAVLVDNEVKVWEITQASIRDDIQKLAESEDWGDPFDYDITINRTGEKLETKYSVMPSPKKEQDLTPEQSAELTSIDLSKLLTNEDPFTDEEAPF